MTDQTKTIETRYRRGKYDPATVGLTAITAIPFLLGLLIGAVGMAVWTMIISGDGW